jgi:lysine 6-dehydrogenase
MSVLVLGTGIVGTAAISDLLRRGHDVTVADSDESSATGAGKRFGAEAHVVDVTDIDALTTLLAAHAVVVSAVPYRFGVDVARAATETDTHYLDFGGNPSVVAAQKAMNAGAAAAGLMIVPDCGLAPGLANVMATQLIDEAEPGSIDSVQMRVGALPQRPVGALGYQLAFNPAGLINEYAEPCEVIEDGSYTTVEPLSRFESVEWKRWGPLEAFSTAGGTSTMCAIHADRVTQLEYKTLRFPGHGNTFRSLLEIGLFSEELSDSEQSPRDVLLRALDASLPRGEPDLVLVRTWIDQGGKRRTLQIDDVERDGFTALARTTAFPATALAHLIMTGAVMRPGVLSMNEAVLGSELLPELEAVNIEVVES